MDAKRWSPLWMFAGGCLTGAALIGWHSRGVLEPVSNAQRADTAADVASPVVQAGVVEQRVRADPGAAGEVVAPARGEAPDTVEPDKAEAGNSVAEVLARLETEYREQSVPAQPEASASPTREEPVRPLPSELAQEQAPSTVSVANAPKPAASAPPAVVPAAVPKREAPSSEARVASLSADDKPAAAETEEAARLASIRDEQTKALERGQQQLDEMKELTALQQAALVQQYTLLQLQLLSQPSATSPAPSGISSPTSPSTTIVVAPTRSQRRGRSQGQARGGRIVASLPSSISATDNPWGFEMQPSMLVR